MATRTRNSPNIAWQRPEYGDLLPRWNLIKDCVAGAAVVKAKKTVYLPKPNPTDTSAENEERYKQYVQRAVFYNFTARTLNGLVGQVMSEDPVLELPKVIEMMKDDIDGGGVSFVQQSSKALSLVTAHGRAGLLVDYPKVEGATTQAQLQQGEVRPTVALVEPWDVINWRVVQVGGRARLALVVLSEQYVTDDDGFEQQWDPQWRVLRLDEEGLCVIEEWIVDPNNKDEFILKPTKDQAGVSQYMPTDSTGKRLDYVPFQFIGAVNNDPNPDLPPLADMAELNVAHYRNSADYEEACYICGQPTPVFSGLTEGWVKDVLKGSVQLGSRSAVPLPEGGSAMLLQVEPNSMPKEAMKDKEVQAVALGAKLVQTSDVQRTATEVNADRAAETSTLASIANNVSEAYESALGFALAFVDASQVPEDGSDNQVITVELNTDFIINHMSPEERAQLIAEWTAGAITDEEMRLNLTRGGVASEEFDSWQTARDEQALTKPVAALPSAGGPGNQPPKAEQIPTS